jgi:DNA-binding NtrC family response regulator
MTRILIIEPSPALRETIGQLLARDYELDRRETLLDAVALPEAAACADLLIASAGPAEWTAELARLNVPVLLLADSGSAAQPFAGREDLKFLLKPFNPYDLKAAVESLIGRPNLSKPIQAAPSAYLDFPYLTHGAARLARRFEALSLPLLIWGERGCGQDRVARAMLRDAARAGLLVALNGLDITADCLKHQQAKLGALCSAQGSQPALLIEGLDQVALAGQSLLLRLIDDIEGKGGRLRIIATANADLLERLYRGEFLERLYYKLAKLALPLSPLRERRADLPALARRLAANYLTEFNLREIDFTPAALARLGDYLWFGNLDELELVIARTLAIHNKARIDGGDLVFDLSALVDPNDSELAAPVAQNSGREATPAQSSMSALSDFQEAGEPKLGASGSPNLRLLVHELAHELKNPMVTIKTFAQLLAERYDDANFRARFQDVVDGDIERMDELLGVMTEYAGFDQPRKASTALMELLSSTLETIQDHCVKRQVHLGWKGNGQGVKIMADAAQLRYALRNTLLAVLSQAKTGSEIELALGESGALVISYLREGERMQSLANYFKDGDVPATNNIVPLRIILAREIVERSGGRFGMDQTDNNRDIVTMEFPVV